MIGSLELEEAVNKERRPAMNLEINKPELLQRVNAHIEAGHFHDADEVLEKALDALDEKSPAPPTASKGPAKNLVELFEPLRGLFTDEEVDALFSRNPSTSRPLDLA
jgi:Arc/MetJ-type ribon-helix-helix transcriptional regulator